MIRFLSKLSPRLKTRIATSIERMGLTVSGYGHANCLRHLLASQGIDTVVDVGANIGQYGNWLRGTVGYQGRILSIEPVSDSHAALSMRAASDPNWIVLPRCALGSETGKATIQVSKNSVSSSILPPSELGIEKMADAVQAIREEVVPVRTLREVRAEHLDCGQRAFLKVDTQGFERAVVEGINGDWEAWPVIQLELSLGALYCGETGFTAMLQLMESCGYRVHGIFPSFWTSQEYRLVQADCLFVREDNYSKKTGNM